MGTAEILREIKKLPVEKRLIVVEDTLKSIRQADNVAQMKKAVEELYNDYKSDKELTAFSNLDMEDFYETK